MVKAEAENPTTLMKKNVELFLRKEKALKQYHTRIREPWVSMY